MSIAAQLSNATSSTTAQATSAIAGQTTRTRQLVGGIAGYDAQAAALAPPAEGAGLRADPRAKGGDKSAEAPGAARTNAPVAVPGRDEAAPKEATQGAEALSPLREAMLQQFTLLEGKGIGDAEFEQVCGKSWWETRKKNEKEAKEHNKKLPELIATWEANCKADPNFAKSNPRPARKDDSVFTTCIAVQGKLLEAAFKATGLAQKRGGDKSDVWSFATMGRLEATKRDAWVESKVGIGQRPKAGDVLVLEMRGEADKVQKDIDGQSSQYGAFAQGEKKLTQEMERLKQASTHANEAISKAAEAKMPLIEARLAALRAAHEQKLAQLQVKLDEARKRTAARAGTEKATRGGRMGGLDFSHVGLFSGMKREVDASGRETGREIWTTFDGGQHVPGKVDAEGAKSTVRIYDPNTNEIAAAKSAPGGGMTQDSKTRWLGGWVDIDKLVDPERKAR